MHPYPRRLAESVYLVCLPSVHRRRVSKRPEAVQVVRLYHSERYQAYVSIPKT